MCVGHFLHKITFIFQPFQKCTNDKNTPSVRHCQTDKQRFLFNSALKCLGSRTVFVNRQHRSIYLTSTLLPERDWINLQKDNTKRTPLQIEIEGNVKEMCKICSNNIKSNFGRSAFWLPKNGYQILFRERLLTRINIYFCLLDLSKAVQAMYLSAPERYDIELNSMFDKFLLLLCFLYLMQQ